MNTHRPQNRGKLRLLRRERPFTANPLRRRSDRVQSWFAALLLVVLVVALPAASLAVGLATYRSQTNTARVEAAQRHQVDARLMEKAGSVEEQTAGNDLQNVRVRWTEKDGTVRTGTAGVAPGTAEGATVKIWVDRDGDITRAPTSLGAAQASGWLAGAMTAGAVAAVFLGARAGFVHLLDRRRYAQWDAEWELVEPRWSRRLPQ